MATEIEDVKESLKNIEEFFKKPSRALVAADADRKEVLELALEELRIIYGRLDESLATVKLRTLTFLGAALALLTYLYGQGDLFIPNEQYGRVFYFLGLGMLLSSIGFLLRSIKSMAWSVPIESKLGKMRGHKTRLGLLELIVDEYLECMAGNIVKYERKAAYLNYGFVLSLCGGILLLVIKNIGG